MALYKDDLITHRLLNQRLQGPKFSTAADAVAHFGAVQGQDYLYSLWALGLRIKGATEALVERALEERQIIRIWPLRSTIHYVTAADARWMVRLSAERVLRSAAGRLRQLELDNETFRRSRSIIISTLRENGPMPRPALMKALDEGGVSTAGQRGYHILWYHAHEGLVGLGPRLGKQPSVVLIDAWLPPTKEYSREEASAELARRYFTSHGPATIEDYTWWSGLAPAEARSGLEAVKQQLSSDSVEGVEYWFPQLRVETTSPSAHLLPFLDEYLVAYNKRDAAVPPEYNAMVDSGNVLFHPSLLIDGRVAGIWKRALKKDRVVITATPLRPLAGDEEERLATAAHRLGNYLGLPAELSFAS